MAAGPWNVYNEFKLAMGDSPMDLHSDSLKIALYSSTSNCANVALEDAQYATLTDETTGLFGYVTGGYTVTPSWLGDYSYATKTFKVDAATWVAAGGNIVARYAVIYDDSLPNKDLVAYCLLDTTPADVTVPDGTYLTISDVAENQMTIFTLT